MAEGIVWQIVNLISMALGNSAEYEYALVFTLQSCLGQIGSMYENRSPVFHKCTNMALEIV